ISNMGNNFNIEEFNHYHSAKKKLLKERIDNQKRDKEECLNENCLSCLGTGKKINGEICIHYISCSGKRCSLRLYLFILIFEFMEVKHHIIMIYYYQRLLDDIESSLIKIKISRYQKDMSILERKLRLKMLNIEDEINYHHDQLSHIGYDFHNSYVPNNKEI